jgi:hypothetical protein
MSVAVATVMPDASPFAGMPPAIVSLLRDEASLSVAKQVLEDAQRDCLTRSEEIRGKRPKLGFLASKKERDSYQEALDVILGQLAGIDALLMRVNGARERLRPILGGALAQYLGTVDPTYKQALQASAYQPRWKAAHSIIADRLKAFLRDVREARNAFADDVKNGRTRHSSNTVWRLSNARLAAVELERAIEELNRYTTEHAATVAGTPFSEIHLPALEQWPCVSGMDLLAGHSPNDAQAGADRILRDFAEFKEPTLETLAGMFEASAGEHNQLAEKRLIECWRQWLTLAEAHLVSDAEIEPTLVDIERRQSQAERARIAAQFDNQPFFHER